VRTRPLGTTGLQVSVLGLGAASLGGVYGDVDERQAVATVHRAFELGIDLFDTSPYYGETRSETVLGAALRGLPRDRYVLVTKAGRYGQDRFDFAPARIARSLDESLARLRQERVDVLLLHDVEFADLDFVLRESLPAAHALKATGKVGHVGLSGLPLTIFRRALQAPQPPDVVLSYCHATLFDHTLGTIAPRLAAAGVPVVNGSPAAMGLLSSRGPRDWHPADAAMRATCAAAARWCTARGVELADLAVAHAVSLPWPVATLCGAADPREVEASVRAATTPPDPELLAAVRAMLAPIQDRTWRQGRPENQ
jgi:L-galactose dehydrogenase